MNNEFYSWGDGDLFLGKFPPEFGLYVLGAYVLVVFVIFVFMDIFSKKRRRQFFHRYFSLVLCGFWGFLYPVIHGELPFWCVGLLCAAIIWLARYLWVVDERRHKKNEELMVSPNWKICSRFWIGKNLKGTNGNALYNLLQ